MSGTRLHSKTAPAIERPVLLIAAHGERGGAGDNARLQAIADRAAARLSGWHVRYGVLSGAPSIETALSGLEAAPIAVWPFFLSDGYFINTALRDRLTALNIDYTLLPEYGGNPELAKTARDMIAGSSNRSPGSILIIGHGSTKADRSRRATERVAETLRAIETNWQISCAFLDEAPYAADAIAALPRGSHLVCLFAGDGLHGRNDIARMTAMAGRDDLNIVNPATDTHAVAQLAVRAAMLCSWEYGRMDQSQL